MGVESQEGKGATFWFTLPLQKPTKEDMISEASIGDSRSGLTCSAIERAAEPRILLAEDNVVNQQVALGILEKLGIHADVADNGAEDIELLKARTYDRVLMDVQMPVMDGLEATRRIRDAERETARTRNGDVGPLNPDARPLTSGRIPIVAMTAHAMKEDQEVCLDAGMDDYIPKPVNPKDLASVLSKWLATESRDPTSEVGGRKSEVRGQEPNGGFQREEAPRRVPIWDKKGFLDRLMGDAELAGTVVENYLTDIPRQMEALKGFIESGDWTAAQHQAHNIKGASANVGGERLRDAAFRIEKAIQEGDRFKAVPLIKELETAFFQLKGAMKQEMKKRQG